MALKGQAKLDYQREYQRKHQADYRLKRKGLITRSNQGLIKGSNIPVRPTLDSLRGLIKSIEAKQEKPQVSVPIPIYNPALHRAGDRVQVQQGKRLVETVIPEIDAGGSPMPEYT